MKRLLLPLLFSSLSLAAHAEIQTVHAQYCLGVYTGRDVIMKDIAQMAQSERDPEERRYLETWVAGHEKAKVRLSDFVVTNAVPGLNFMSPGWQESVMAKARQDLEEDAQARLACETGQKCTSPEASKRVNACNDLSWLN